jgi:hypothetical protein
MNNRKLIYFQHWWQSNEVFIQSFRYFVGDWSMSRQSIERSLQGLGKTQTPSSSIIGQKSCFRPGWPDKFDKNRQRWDQPHICQHKCISLIEKKVVKKWSTFVIFKKLSRVNKQSTIFRNFVQSGHPVSGRLNKRTVGVITLSTLSE